MSRVSFINIDELLKTYKLSFDADGVLINSRAPVVKVFNKLLKTDYKQEDLNSWTAIFKWAMKAGLNKDEAFKLDRKLWTDSNILFESPPMPGAVEFTRKLHEQGIKLTVATSRIPKFKESTIDWFRKWMPWIEQVYIRENKDIPAEVFKAEAVKQIGSKVHFEDDPIHAKSILDRTEARVVFMPHIKKIPNFNSNRVIQIFTKSSEIPNLWHVYQQLKDKNVYVAQY
ncbi:HAD family phosphatase [Candidatus Woesebacteria bacterium]|nr:HAD family phosphatase [Candidatus Woesebacteria bacterium]